MAAGKKGKRGGPTRASLGASSTMTKANINAKPKSGVRVTPAQAKAAASGKAAGKEKAGFAFNTGVGQHILKNPQTSLSKSDQVPVI